MTVSGEGHNQDPEQPEIDAMITDVERLLQDESTQRLVRHKGLMDDLKPSAAFARDITTALQIQTQCFDQEVLDEVLAADDVAIRIWSPEQAANKVIDEDDVTDLEILRGFVCGLTGLHDLLGSDIARNDEFNQGLLEQASGLYNAVFVCLTHFFTEEEIESFETVSSALELHLAPLTVGWMQFDEEGWAIKPERPTTLQDRLQEGVDVVHDEYRDKLKAVLPVHDSNSSFLAATILEVYNTAESVRKFRKHGKETDQDLTEFIEDHILGMGISGHVEFYRERQYQNLSPEAEKQIKALIRQYVDGIINVYDDLGIEPPSLSQD